MCDICERASTSINLELAKGLDQSWAQDWGTGDWRQKPNAAAMLKWLRESPKEARDIILRFPPECIVRALPGERLRVPHGGTVGVVSGYTLDPRTRRMMLAVKQSPTSGAAAEVPMDKVEVVGYHAGFTAEEVQRILCDA